MFAGIDVLRHDVEMSITLTTIYIVANFCMTSEEEERVMRRLRFRAMQRCTRLPYSAALMAVGDSLSVATHRGICHTSSLAAKQRTNPEV